MTDWPITVKATAQALMNEHESFAAVGRALHMSANSVVVSFKKLGIVSAASSYDKRWERGDIVNMSEEDISILYAGRRYDEEP